MAAGFTTDTADGDNTLYDGIEDGIHVIALECTQEGRQRVRYVLSARYKNFIFKNLGT